MPRAAASRDVNESLAQSRAGFLAAFARGDVASACSVYAERARLLAPSADLVEGRDAIERFWRAGRDSGIAAVELEMLDVMGDRNVAYEIGRYALCLDGDSGAAECGAYLLIHERQSDGTWRRSVEMFNPAFVSVS